MGRGGRGAACCLAASAWGGGGGVVGGWMELSEEGRGGVGHAVYCVCRCGGVRGGDGLGLVQPNYLPALYRCRQGRRQQITSNANHC